MIEELLNTTIYNEDLFEEYGLMEFEQEVIDLMESETKKFLQTLQALQQNLTSEQLTHAIHQALKMMPWDEWSTEEMEIIGDVICPVIESFGVDIQQVFEGILFF